jgi:hypothetical protein
MIEHRVADVLARLLDARVGFVGKLLWIERLTLLFYYMLMWWTIGRNQKMAGLCTMSIEGSTPAAIPAVEIFGVRAGQADVLAEGIYGTPSPEAVRVAFETITA